MAVRAAAARSSQRPRAAVAPNTHLGVHNLGNAVHKLHDILLQHLGGVCAAQHSRDKQGGCHSRRLKTKKPNATASGTHVLRCRQGRARTACRKLSAEQDPPVKERMSQPPNRNQEAKWNSQRNAYN